jgi:hypothetical protein
MSKVVLPDSLYRGAIEYLSGDEYIACGRMSIEDVGRFLPEQLISRKCPARLTKKCELEQQKRQTRERVNKENPDG